jgi:hypothetical protein
MQGLLETQGLTVAGHLVHGQVKVVPSVGARLRTPVCTSYEYILEFVSVIINVR